MVFDSDILHIPLALAGLALFALDQYDRARAKYPGSLFTWGKFISKNISGVLKNVICNFIMGGIAASTGWEPSAEFSVMVGYTGSAALKNRWAKSGQWKGLINGKQTKGQ